MNTFKYIQVYSITFKYIEIYHKYTISKFKYIQIDYEYIETHSNIF
jgi:hypothetical protein